MRGGEIVRRARTRTGLTADELAARLGVAPAELAAWEQGDPPYSVVARVAEAADISLTSLITEPDPDPDDLVLIEQNLRLTPQQRLDQMVRYARFIEAGRAAVKAAR